METWDPSERQNLTTTIAHEVFNRTGNAEFKKGDLFLVELLVKKKWLAPNIFFAAGSEGGETTRTIKLESAFGVMGNRTLAPSMGRFLSSLLRRLAEELRTSQNNKSWKVLWLDHFKADLANALLSTNEQIALNTELYVVPGAFHEEKEGFGLFLHYLLDERIKSQSTHDALAVIACLRTGKECGWLTEAQIDEYAGALGGYDTLTCHQYGFLRSKTIRLMIVSSSTSSALPFTHIAILRAHLDDLFAEQDPQIRNEIYSALRTMFERIVASSYALNKRIQSSEARSQALNLDDSKDVEDLREQLRQQKSFMCWFLNELLPAQLQPNSSYQRVILALRVYSFWLPQIERDVVKSKSTGNLAADVKLSRKKQADKEHINLPFDPEIQYSSLLRLLVERLMDPYDDIRSLAAGLIKELHQSSEVPWPQIIQQAQKMIEDSGRPGQEDGFSRILEVLHDLSLKDPTIAREVWLSYDVNPKAEPYDYSIVNLIFTLLDEQSHARSKTQNLSRLDNSLLGALSLIYKRKDAAALFDSRTAQSTLQRVLALSQSIWAQQRDILCNESPEGRGASSQTLGEEDSEDEEDQLNSQGFLSYSWRVVSEASSLLGTIAKFAPKSFATSSEAGQFLQNCGELLIEQLTSIRHRGSLSSIFPALTSICFQCLTTDSYRSQPSMWLDRLLKIVSTSGKLITRRSAGLPMAIGAVIISEIQAKRKPLAFLEYAFASFKKTLHASMSVGEALSVQADNLELPQVHALNCIRFLFMDSHLSDVIDPYVSISVGLAFSCFRSHIWALRNCGIMLYTAIINRVFPTDGSNRIVESDKFFQKYKGLNRIILIMLSNESWQLDDHLIVESVYPALDLVSRLTFVEKAEPKDNDPTASIKDLVIRHLGCKVWKIREAAAKSMVAFTPVGDRALELMEQFILQDFKDDSRDNNLIHGGLCAVREIYEQRLAGAEGEIKQKASRIISDAAELYLTPKNKVSPINQALFIQISRIVLAEDGKMLQAKIVPFCCYVLVEADGRPPKDFAYSLLRKEIAKTMAVGCPNAACGFISFDDPDYGVALSEALTKTSAKIEIDKSIRGLRVAAVQMTADGRSGKTDSLESQHTSEVVSEQEDGITVSNALCDVLKSHDWEQYRLAASNLLAFSSHKQVIDLSTLAQLASSGSIEPLQESAIILSGRNFSLLSMDGVPAGKLAAHIEAWIQLLFRAVKDETPYPSRMAALRSIEAASKVLKVEWDENMQEQHPTPEDLLPVWIVLHRLLNDDEVDIRASASNVAMKLISQNQHVTPLRAERKVFGYLAATKAGGDAEIQRILLNDLLGVPLDNATEIKEQLITANTPNTLLFKIEKQNLYRDDCRCMKHYLALLSAATPTPTDKTAVEYLQLLAQYVVTGIETLSEIAQEYQAAEDEGGVSIDSGKLRAADGMMGWTTATEEIFVLGMRIANAFRLLGTWYPEQQETYRTKEEVKKFVDYGAREDVGFNKAWLDAFGL
ncbi:hypothetical protein TWF696_003927 [Orbilia brochopaga]